MRKIHIITRTPKLISNKLSTLYLITSIKLTLNISFTLKITHTLPFYQKFLLFQFYWIEFLDNKSYYRHQHYNKPLELL